MKLKPLIIDDEDIVGMLISRLVIKSGMHDTPIFYKNALEALDKIKSEKTDAQAYLIFLDINMPNFSGWEFLDLLSFQINPTPVYVVIMTSSINTEDKTKAFSYQKVVGYYEKPVSLASMEEIKNIQAIAQFKETPESKKHFG